jgi:hypothetical protein
MRDGKSCGEGICGERSELEAVIYRRESARVYRQEM